MVRLPREGLELRLGAAAAHAFSAHHAGLTAEQAGQVGVDLDARRRLVQLRVLVPCDAAQVIARGMVSATRGGSNGPRLDFSELEAQFVLIGSPVDFAQVGRGPCYLAPSLIRVHLEQENVALQDLGNLAWFPSEGLLEYGKRLSHAVAIAKDRGATPILLGGDHALSYFSIRAIADRGRRIGVVQFDAHNDLGLSEAPSLDELTHANFAASVRQLPIEFLLQVGVRTSQLRCASGRGPEFHQILDTEVSTFGEVLSEMLRRVPVDELYVSVDMDCLDPNLVPDVTTPLGGGMREAELLECLRLAIVSAPLAGIDIVEVCGGPSKGTAAHAAAILINAIVA